MGKDYVIKDSGSREHYSTGAVRDHKRGVGRMDLLPWEAIMRVSKHCEQGALKYGERNVDKGIPQHSLVDSAFRHLAKYMSGWDDEAHLVAACWNLLWGLQQEELCMSDLLDLPWQVYTQDSKQDSTQVLARSKETSNCCKLLARMEANGMDMNAIYEMLRDNAIETIGCSLDDDGK